MITPSEIIKPGFSMGFLEKSRNVSKRGMGFARSLFSKVLDCSQNALSFTLKNAHSESSSEEVSHSQVQFDETINLMLKYVNHFFVRTMIFPITSSFCVVVRRGFTLTSAI